jgi:dTDP-4-dehydrorhamnose 3,5-epimerase-like enzyme
MNQLPSGLCSISQARLIELPLHPSDSGAIAVAEAGAQVPFTIARMFTLQAPLGAVRGEHAHRRCSQFMLCVSGAVDIACADGREERVFSLDRGNLALLVPPTIWNTVTVRKDNSVLAVLCDRPYEAHDYIRDFGQFVAFREAPHS